MFQARALVLLAVLISACGGTPPATSGPAATATPGGPNGAPTAAPVGPTAPPGGAPTVPVQPGGDSEAKARALVPSGATETGEFEVGGMYQLYVSSTMTLDQLKAFWAQAIPAAGMTATGSFEVEGTLTMAFTNPDGGIVATPGDEGGYLIVISVGTSS